MGARGFCTMVMKPPPFQAREAIRRFFDSLAAWLSSPGSLSTAGWSLRSGMQRMLRFGPVVLLIAAWNALKYFARLTGQCLALLGKCLVTLFWHWPRAAVLSISDAWARYQHRRYIRQILREEPEPKPRQAKPRRRVTSEPFPATLARKIASPALTLLTLSGAAGLFWWSYNQPSPIDEYPLSTTLAAPAERELVLLTASGVPFARRGGCSGAPVRKSELPQHFVDALLAMEDRRFYNHFGIDPTGVARAALANYEADRIVQGGSTITQQLAKISYLSGEKTMERKLEEVVAVLRLELNLTKDEILERYLSRAYFGEGCFGLRAAARHYFKQPVDELTLGQSVLLVALLKSPTAVTSAPEWLKERTELVLNAMVETGALSKPEAEAAKPATPVESRRKSTGDFYADWVASTVKLPNDGKMSPLPVRTAYDPKLQRAAEEAVATIMKRSGRARKTSQAALVAMRPNGQVVAMVGGVDYGQSQFNRATQALRQPGSSFKSFVYLAAVRAGGDPQMVVMDQPLQIGDWRPENYGKSYRGPVTLQQAFSSSINTVAVRLSEAVGRKEVIQAARDMGITSELHPEPSIALGTSEVTLLELTSAYSAFAAGAYPIMPWGVISTGEKGKKRALPPKGAGKWQLSQADTMRDFLSATVQHGTGRGARLGYPTFGKTGTSQNYRDAWFIGFAGNLVVGVWVGNDDNSPMAGVTGGNLPTMIWARFMRQARKLDSDFTTELPQQIAGFEARPNPARRQYAMHGRLQSLLVDERYIADSGGPDYRHRRPPMAFGYDERRFRRRFRRDYDREYERGYGRGYDGREERRFFERREDPGSVYRRVFGGAW